jgi:hypothetical protein
MRIGRRKMTRQIWDALVRAGAQPIGPPPQPPEKQKWPYKL